SPAGCAIAVPTCETLTPAGRVHFTTGRCPGQEVPMISFVCPRCRQGCAVEEEEGGKKTTRPSCGRTRVPPQRVGTAALAARDRISRDGRVGESEKQERKGKSSVALQRLGALLVLGGLVVYFSS